MGRGDEHEADTEQCLKIGLAVRLEGAMAWETKFCNDSPLKQQRRGWIWIKRAIQGLEPVFL